MGDYLQLNYSEKNYTGKIEYEGRILPFAKSPLLHAKLSSARVLTNGENVKTIYDVTLEVDEQFDYLPGDTIGVLPENDGMEVKQILERLNLSEKCDIEFSLTIREGTTKKKATIPRHVPEICSLQQVFTKCIDIRSPPKKIFLKALINYTSAAEEVDLLASLTAPTGSKQYTDFISDKGRTLLKLLNCLESCQPPIELILGHSVPLQPRPYSISSGPADRSPHITFFVQEHSDGSKGVCTGWLDGLIRENKTARVPFYYRIPNDFRIPADLTVPIIMISTGTGLAPFYGFLQHRASLMKDCSENVEECWLFHGCRYALQDALYKDEIDYFLKLGALNRFYLSASRDAIEKDYVQHRILKVAAEFVEKILSGAIIFICGDPKTVVKDVKDTIVHSLSKHVNMSLEEAHHFLVNLEKEKRLLVDAWM